MLRPTNGQLLRVVHTELTAQVLSTLSDGVPHRQLKAALHLLHRLERSWDRQLRYRNADNVDNVDLDRTLDRVLQTLPSGVCHEYDQLRARVEWVREPPLELSTVDNG